MSKRTPTFFANAVMALGLMLSACGADSALGERPLLTGQIERWDRGAGFIL